MYIISDPKTSLNVLIITNRYNICGSGTIDYEVEAHTLDAQETSAARQGSTTGNIHGSITKNFQVGLGSGLDVWKKGGGSFEGFAAVLIRLGVGMWTKMILG